MSQLSIPGRLLPRTRIVGNREEFVCTDVLAEEQAHEAIFQPLPFHYIEVAHLLLRHAKEAFEEADDVLYQVSQCITWQTWQ